MTTDVILWSFWIPATAFAPGGPFYGIHQSHVSVAGRICKRNITITVTPIDVEECCACDAQDRQDIVDLSEFIRTGRVACTRGGYPMDYTQFLDFFIGGPSKYITSLPEDGSGRNKIFDLVLKDGNIVVKYDTDPS